MRRRRDVFARMTFVPRPNRDAKTCAWCGTPRAPRRPLYSVTCESDGGRASTLREEFCSWSCAESYYGEGRIGR